MPTLEYLKEQPWSHYVSKDSVRRKIDKYQWELFWKIWNRYYPTDNFFKIAKGIEKDIKENFMQVPIYPVECKSIFEWRL